MDVSKSEQRLLKLAAVDTTRQPLVLAEKNNAAFTTRLPRTREVSSRYKSPTPSSPSGPRRCLSPTVTRTIPTPFQAVQKRAVSVERKRPSTPLSPQSFSTLIHDSSTAVPVSSRRLSIGRIQESLWPSTMRNLSVSVHSDNISSHVSKKEKERPVSNVSLDLTLRPSNVAHRQQLETSTLSPSPERKRNLEGKYAHDPFENAKYVDSSRKPSPDRKRSLLQGKYAHDQSENEKPVDGARKPSPERYTSLLLGKYAHEQSENAKLVDGSWKPSPERKSHGKHAPDQSENAKPVDSSQKPSPERKISLLHQKYAPVQSENEKHVDGSWKPSLERKRSLLQGKRVPDQSENGKLVDGLPNRLIEQHRWPSRIGGKLSSSSLNRSVDLGDKIVTKFPAPFPRIASSLKRMPMSDSSGEPLLKYSSDAARLLSLDEIGQVGSEAISIDDKTLRAPLPARILSASSLDKTITTSGSRAQSPSRPSVSMGVSSSRGRPSTPPPRGVSPTLRVDSPSRISTSTSSSQSHSSISVLSLAPRGVSPTRMRTSTSTPVLSSSPRGVSPTPRVDSPSRIRTFTSSSQSHSSTSLLSSAPRGVSPTPRVVSPTRMRTSTSTPVLSSSPRGVSPTPRVVSPTRMRISTSSSQSHSSTSVLSFITDHMKGRKDARYIEDSHRLCLLYNRYLQWRFANAHAESVLYIEKVNAEETLYNDWNTYLSLWDALIKKKIVLQRLKLEFKLNSILNDQMDYLNDWALLERHHTSSLAGAVEDLEASTLCLPITGGARVDTESLKAVVSSAIDVMQAIGSTICSLLPKAEGVTHCVSEYAAIASQEKNMLDQCEALLASTAAMQLEEYSLRSHLIQAKETLKRNKQPILATKTKFPWP